jgi:hypothetical protein
MKTLKQIITELPPKRRAKIHARARRLVAAEVARQKLADSVKPRRKASGTRKRAGRGHTS